MINHTDKSTEILSPKEFVKYSLGSKIDAFKNIDVAILCYDSQIFNNHIASEFKGEIIKQLTGKVILYNNLALCGDFGIGAPSAGAFMEELIACGIKNIICVGSAGSLVKEINIGDVLICTKAFSDEGTSQHYIPNTTITFPSRNLTNYIQANLKLITNIHKAVSWTTDAVYRETQSKVEHYIQQGANIVEMEASALNAIAKFRNVEVAHIFVIGDTLAGGKWQPNFKSDEISDLSNKILKQLLVMFH